MSRARNSAPCRRPWARLVALALGCAAGAAEAGALVPVAAQDLCVTEGTVAGLGAGRLSVDSAKMRAYLNRATRESIEARFVYLGGSANSAPLGSGKMRRQFGLKLRAQDACNLVYVMWRIEPDSKLVVSVKSNPGQSASSECGNRGYRNIKPQRAAAIPVLRRAEPHVLRADIEGVTVRVYIDDSPVWEGGVGPEASRFEGPVGMRSDNARLQIELRAGQPLDGDRGRPRACAGVGADAE
jgi:hypothetical protein